MVLSGSVTGSLRLATSLLPAFVAWFHLAAIQLLSRLEPAADARRLAPGQVRHVPARLQPLSGQLPALLARLCGLVGGTAAALGAHRAQPGRTGQPAQRRLVTARMGPAAAWLRPVLAVAGAAAMVAAGVLALGQVHQPITQTNSVSTPGKNHHPSSASSAAQVEPGAWSLPIGGPAQPGRKRPVTEEQRYRCAACGRSHPHHEHHADAHRQHDADAHRQRHADPRVAPSPRAPGRGQPRLGGPTWRSAS